MSFEAKRAYWNMVKEQERIYVSRARINEGILRNSGLPFVFEGVIKLRDRRYPAVDYDPGQQKWFVGNRGMMGDANALISFLERNRKVLK